MQLKAFYPLVLAAAAAALLDACASHQVSGGFGRPSSPAALNNGEMIFQTGKDAAGKQIVATKPPLRLSCAACHNANGSGGVKFAGGARSADLRENALVTRQKKPYTLALIERAISVGVDNEGKPLDPVMPRWKLSKKDVHDVAAYVLTLK
ncbi:MAG: hypothetical protein NVS9B12_05460 [Vulcanimicrobiaceae bacterium]